MAMISTCPKFEDTTAMDLTCAKIQKISGNLQEDLSATTTHESDVIRLVLEIAGFEYEEASNKIRYWEELCNNLTHVGLPESTIITFIFLCLRDLNQLRELLQTAEILPRLANVRFAVSFSGPLSFSGDVIFRGTRQRFYHRYKYGTPLDVEHGYDLFRGRVIPICRGTDTSHRD